MNMIAPTLADRPMRKSAFARTAVVMCLLVVMICGMMVTACATPAAASGIESGIKNGMKEAFTLIRNIVTPIAAVAFAIYGLSMLFGGQKGMESGKKGMLICALAIAAVWLAPLAVEAIQSWFKSVGTGSVF